MDKKIEGYLAGAMVLIPVGISMISSPVTPDGYGIQITGFGMVLIGLVAIYLRGNKKEKRVKEYVKKKVGE